MLVTDCGCAKCCAYRILMEITAAENRKAEDERLLEKCAEILTREGL